MRFSMLSLVRGAVTRQDSWPAQWRKAVLKPAYEAIIVGGGGHGLAAAYYLAKEHGLRDVAVIEKGWIGGGNTGRNTTIIRSNYLWDESAAIYDHALKLWPGLSSELNYNVMFSPRGVLLLAHTHHDVQSGLRHVHANRLNGIENEWLDRQAVKEFCPPLDTGPEPRFPILGGALQRGGGTARHDAVAWGYARAASERNVDIVEGCAVRTILRSPSGEVSGIETDHGIVRTSRVAVAVAGATSRLLNHLGLRLPLETFPLQALVSEPVKPVLPCVVMSNTVHGYVSQSDKGELVVGAGTDQYLSYRQWGSGHVLSKAVEAVCQLFPQFARLRVMRTWAGVVDVTPDRSPIIGATGVGGLFVNCGWGTGGFKATPAAGRVLAHAIATGEPHPLAAPFSLERFSSGRLIDEAAAAAVAH